ncbi:MAG TPA: hypothetical protein PK228_05060 [Saprospiraceae bacterium]|nr:hypothetical protein [Saprospiraceae bacterium]
MHDTDNFQAKIARKRIKQNDFPKAVVGNCKPHTIFTATKKLPQGSQTVFPPPAINFLLAAHHFSRCLHLRSKTGSKQDDEVRRPVEKRVILRGVSVKLNHSST